ncbi:MAG: MoaD/ThiS family protein [Acidobacteria bacterium]|nr:MoaD/ThiS family protein [Acidobacteriota bacterium]
MPVTIRLFARLRDVVGSPDVSRDVAAGASIRAVWEDLVAEHPDLAAYTRVISCARNAEYAKLDDPVADGDEIAFLPPVSGG